MINPLENAGLFLIQTLFDLYIFAVFIRILLQWLGAQYANPVVQFVVRITDPVIKPVRKILPRVRSFDFAGLCVLLLLEMLKFTLVLLLLKTSFPNMIGLLLLAFGDILSLLVNTFFYAILIVVILSWVNPLAMNPFVHTLYLITEPLLQPARRLVPPISGFDLSPIVVLIALKLITILLVTPLNGLAAGMI